VWIRDQQIEQADFAYRQATAKEQTGSANLADVAQTRLALASFNASLIAAQASLLDQEAALRSILGLVHSSTEEYIPTSPPTDVEPAFDWDGIVVLAEEQRPDLIELKLVIEADQQLLLQARNQARPQVDAVALYRWNGLEGEMPIGTDLRSGDGDFSDWQLGVNFSVPIGLRRSRAGLRRQELILARDQVNLHQAMLTVVHTLAAQIRSLDSLYAQYEALVETRIASEENLRQQVGEWQSGRTDFITLLQAITSWGNSVSSVAATLTQYNTSLANLERETGTILEVHGVRLFEERYCSLGPLGSLGKGRCYPRSMHPTENSDRYEAGEKPSEEFFDLQKPDVSREDRPPREPPAPSPQNVLGPPRN
jgi:outer membrane protein TolC